ncbi:hypothetical protein MRX96_047427, partial [Rhipicephalus microplus]
AVSDVAYHKFPVDSPQRQQWIDFVRSSGRGLAWTPRMSSRVCSRHFAPSCYRHDPVRAGPARLPGEGATTSCPERCRPSTSVWTTVTAVVRTRAQLGELPPLRSRSSSVHDSSPAQAWDVGPAVLVANHVVRMVKRTTTTGTMQHSSAVSDLTVLASENLADNTE